MSEPTPGRWTANLHHTKEVAGRTYGFVVADGLVPIAAVTLGAEGVPQDEGRANARLIAAAPELYAALTELLAASLTETLLKESASRRANARAQARAILAKARGEQP